MSKFSETQMAEFKRLVSRYPEGKQKSALLPVLHLAQNSFGGWLSEKTLDYVAELLNITPIEVCQTGPCMISGSDNIIQYIQDKLGIKPGETTQDGLFTLKTVECLGACGYAPMMQLGKTYREHLTKDKVDAIIAECKTNAAE
jgi:NADH-quinone oxidoreductase subunit E